MAWTQFPIPAGAVPTLAQITELFAAIAERANNCSNGASFGTVASESANNGANLASRVPIDQCWLTISGTPTAYTIAGAINELANKGYRSLSPPGGNPFGGSGPGPANAELDAQYLNDCYSAINQLLYVMFVISDDSTPSLFDKTGALGGPFSTFPAAVADFQAATETTTPSATDAATRITAFNDVATPQFRFTTGYRTTGTISIPSTSPYSGALFYVFVTGTVSATSGTPNVDFVMGGSASGPAANTGTATLLGTVGGGTTWEFVLDDYHGGAMTPWSANGDTDCFQRVAILSGLGPSIIAAPNFTYT